MFGKVMRNPKYCKKLLEIILDAFTAKLDEAVAAARLHKEWRQEYMKIEMMMRDSRREEREEGIKKLIKSAKNLGASKLSACEQLIQQYALNENKANEKIEMYWSE